MKNYKNIGVFAIDDEAILSLPKESKDHIIQLLEKRCNIGNHDRFHNISFDTISALSKEQIKPIKQIIKDEIGEWRWKYKPIGHLIRNNKIAENIHRYIIHMNPSDDWYVKTIQLYRNYITPKRFTIDIPDVM